MATIVKPTPADKREVNLNASIKLAKDGYVVRFKDEEFKMSSKDNPMIVLTPEFISPDSFTAPDGSKVNIAGVELRPFYVTLQSRNEDGSINASKSQTMIDKLYDLCRKLGIELPSEGIDIENPPKLFKGKYAYCICDSEEYVRRKDPTPEQRAKGEQGSEIHDPSTGQPIKSYSPKIVEIYGPAPENMQKAGPF